MILVAMIIGICAAVMELRNCGNFREAVTFSLLFAKNIVLINDEPFEGFELRFLDLVALVSKGSRVVLSNGNRVLHFKPGALESDFDAEITFDCRNERSITYFLEPLILMGLFSKSGIRLTFEGITNDSVDLTADAVKDGLLPLLKASYGEQVTTEIKVNQRGFRPTAGGKVLFSVRSIRNSLTPLQVKPQKVYVKRIRGTVVTSKTSAQFANRIIDRTRAIFNDYIPDVWIYSLLVKNSPDTYFGLSLHTNNFIPSEASYDKVIEGQNIKTPEQVAEEACLGLLDDIRYSSGVAPTSFLSLLLTLMALGKGTSAVPIGRLTEQAVGTLRLLRLFGGVKFEFESLPNEDENAEEQLVLAKCSGVGLVNRAIDNV